MTTTINLPDELAFQLNASLPEEERSEFAINAIADALEARRRDEEECVAALEEALEDMEMGRSLSFEDEQARWQSQKVALVAKYGAHTA